MTEFNLGMALLTFIVFFALDILSSWFIIALNKLQIATTTILTFLLQMGVGIGVIQYTHNFYYLIFAAIGATLGNFLLVYFEKKRQKKASLSKNLIK